MLKDRKIVFLGDSITEGCGASEYSKSFVAQFEKETGAIVTNLGIGGTRIAYQKVPSVNNLLFDRYYETRIYEIPLDAEVIVVFGGTNDYGHGDAPFGTINDTTVYTFYGALNSLMSKLKYVFPNAQIIFATPLRRMQENKESLNDYGYPHHASFKDYRDAIIIAAAKYNYPVIDLYRRINQNNTFFWLE